MAMTNTYKTEYDTDMNGKCLPTNLTAFTNVRNDVSLPTIFWTNARNRYSPSFSAIA